MTNIVADSSIGKFEIFVIDIEAVLSLEMTLSSPTNRVEPTLTEDLADGLHVKNVFGLLPKHAGRCVLVRISVEKKQRSRS